MQDVKKAIIQKIAGSRQRLRPAEVADDLHARLGIQPDKVKRAINELVLEGKLEFTYYGQAFIELPLMMNQLSNRRTVANPSH
jgi:hypothetical protein